MLIYLDDPSSAVEDAGISKNATKKDYTSIAFLVGDYNLLVNNTTRN